MRQGQPSLQLAGRAGRDQRGGAPGLYRPGPRARPAMLPRLDGGRLMAGFLLELLSEEIPARMQARAAADLERLFAGRLKAAGLAWTSLVAHVTPRRMALGVEGLPLATPDSAEERKGPRV